MDISELMNAYRECVRGMWNHTFRPSLGPNSDFDDIDSFWVVRDVLFSELVLRQLGIPSLSRGSRTDRAPVSGVYVIPRPDPVPIMVNRPSPDGNQYWDDPVELVKTEGLSLAWIDFFDWDMFGYIDLQYHLVKVEACKEYPHVVGRTALVEVQYATVSFVEPQ